MRSINFRSIDSESSPFRLNERRVHIASNNKSESFLFNVISAKEFLEGRILAEGAFHEWPLTHGDLVYEILSNDHRFRDI